MVNIAPLRSVNHLRDCLPDFPVNSMVAVGPGLGQTSNLISGLLVMICGVIAIVLCFLLLIRCVKGFLTLNRREPIPNPKSWWLGERELEWPR